MTIDIEQLKADREARFFIKKAGYYYRPHSKGYTTSAILAGLYTQDEAEGITHPNGPDGPRDGMSFIAEHLCPDEDYKAYRELADTIASQAAEIALLKQREAEIMAKLQTIEKGVWRAGQPDKVSGSEWFIAKTKYGDRVVLRSLPDEHSYDYTTADHTYMIAENVVAWMQFPDSHFLPPDTATESECPYTQIAALRAQVEAADALVDDAARLADVAGGFDGRFRMRKLINAYRAARSNGGK